MKYRAGTTGRLDQGGRCSDDDGSELLANSAGWGPGGWWFIFPLFWLLLFGGVIFMLVRGRRGRDQWHQSQSAEGVLAERYARGEIAEEEYRERLEVLKGSR